MFRFQWYMKLCLQIVFVLFTLKIYLYVTSHFGSGNNGTDPNNPLKFSPTRSREKVAENNSIYIEVGNSIVTRLANKELAAVHSNESVVLEEFVEDVAQNKACGASYLMRKKKYLDTKYSANRSAEDLPVTWMSYFDMNSIDHSVQIRLNIVKNEHHNCFKLGTIVDYYTERILTIQESKPLNETANSKEFACRCNAKYSGKHCSIPTVVSGSNPAFNLRQISLRSKPRRIIQAFPLNIEFEMLEARFDEIGDVVDVFLILESNYTMYGAPKKLHLLERLRNNLVQEKISKKMVHIFLDYFPEGGKQNGWITQGLHQNFLGTHGARKIRNWRDDDLWITTDADEVPKKEVLLFLKWHDNYPFPISFYHEWSVYGFFWLPDAENGRNYWSVVSMAIYKYILEGNVYSIRNGFDSIKKNRCNMKLITTMTGGQLVPWSIGSNRLKAGWHCSWCTDLDRIRVKLVSAQNGDFPRWGDYSEKLNISYIRKMVREGLWFDNISKMVPAKNLKTPDFFRKGNNSMIYRYLLNNVYAN